MPIQLASGVVPKNGGTYSLIEDNYVLGGFRAVADIVERSSLSSSIKKAGMLVLTLDTQTFYTLASDLITWLPLGSEGPQGLPGPSGATSEGLAYEVHLQSQTKVLPSWTKYAASADLTKLVAHKSTTLAGSLYTSTDSGATWTERTSAGSRIWGAIASSADGMTLVAGYKGSGASGDVHLLMSYDAGATWVVRSIPGTTTWSGAVNWADIKITADGTKIIASYSNSLSLVVLSSDSGVTFTVSPSITAAGIYLNIGCVGISDSGSILVAGVVSQYLYTSTNFGATWTARITTASYNWADVSVSSDGVSMVACHTASSLLYISTNSGIGWSTNAASTLRTWRSVAISSSGMKIIASYTGAAFKPRMSINSGLTWFDVNNCTGGLRDFVFSQDGTKIAAITDYKRIVISSDSGESWVDSEEPSSQPQKANTVAMLGSVSVGSRSIPSLVDTSGDLYAFQPALYNRKIGFWLPNGGSLTSTTFGLGTFSQSGIPTIAAVASTNAQTRSQNIRYITNASSNSSAGLIGTPKFLLGDGLGNGGFFFSWRMSPTGSYSAGNRFFIGVASAPASAVASSQNAIGFCLHTDGSLYLSYGGTVGSRLALSTVSFQVGYVYEFNVYSPPEEAGVIYYSINRPTSTTDRLTPMASGVISPATVGVGTPSPSIALSPLATVNTGIVTSATGLALHGFYSDTQY